MKIGEVNAQNGVDLWLLAGFSEEAPIKFYQSINSFSG
jgi:hypothetical protein